MEVEITETITLFVERRSIGHPMHAECMVSKTKGGDPDFTFSHERILKNPQHSWMKKHPQLITEVKECIWANRDLMENEFLGAGGILGVIFRPVNLPTVPHLGPNPEAPKGGE